MEKQQTTYALPKMIAAMLIFGSIGIFRRYLPLPSALLACYRGFCGALFLIVVLKLQRRRLGGRIGAKKTILLAVSGAVMGANWILLFEAYNYTTVATATLCYYMAPTIVMLLSPLLFREHLSRRKGICVLVSFIGMVLVSGVVESGVPSLADLRGVLFGLGAAVLYAVVVIMNKKLSGIDSFQKTVIQLAAAAVALLPYVLLTGQTSFAGLSGTAVILLLVVGFVHTGIAYLLYFGSMDGLRTQTVALLSYLDPVTALLLSALLLHERLTLLGVIGAVLILGAAFLGDREPNVSGGRSS